jgi:hypothetical protein
VLTYRATVDQPQRFVHSRAAGAHVGLTPKRYQSSEIDYGDLAIKASRANDRKRHRCRRPKPPRP